MSFFRVYLELSDSVRAFREREAVPTPPPPVTPPPPPPLRMLLSQREAAQLLGMRRETVAKLIAQGRLRTVRSGSREKVPRDALQRLIDSGDLQPARRGRPPKAK